MSEEKKKEIKFDFFRPGLARDIEFDLGVYLSEIAGSTGSGYIRDHAGYLFELRKLSREGSLIWGEFAKFRRDDLPHLGKPGGEEHQLDVAEGQGLIEKNFFCYRLEDDLLIYQVNNHGSRESQLAAYISDAIEATLVFNPVIQAESAGRLMSGGEVRELNLSFARPTSPEMYPDDDFSDTMLDMMNSLGGSRVTLTIKGRKSAASNEERFLNSRVVKTLAAAFARESYTSVARVDVSDNGVEHPIDLLADRIRSTQSVLMAGRYPVKRSIHEAINSAFAEKREALYAVLGEPGNRI